MDPTSSRGFGKSSRTARSTANRTSPSVPVPVVNSFFVLTAGRRLPPGCRRHQHTRPVPPAGEPVTMIFRNPNGEAAEDGGEALAHS
eukprot:149636-Hanusia_phi.AAC.3